MAWHARDSGYITVAAAGTPEAIVTSSYPCQTIVFQQIQSNTGKLYVCDRITANKTTGVGILITIPAPTLDGTGVAVVLPYASVSVPSAPAALNALSYWVDADVNDDQCLVSIVRNQRSNYGVKTL